MGLLTILKKVKQKEKELRILILGNLDQWLISWLYYYNILPFFSHYIINYN